MLVLSRKLGETIIINGDIEVTVLEINRASIRLGIKAPRGVPIYREELLPIKPELEKPKEATDERTEAAGQGE
jgi:carbon storage regulator